MRIAATEHGFFLSGRIARGRDFFAQREPATARLNEVFFIKVRRSMVTSFNWD